MDKPLCKDTHFKVYENPRKIGENYFEVLFTEYFADGTVHRTGIEDFSSERLKTIEKYYVYRWNGRQMPSGYRYTDRIGVLRVSPNAYKIRVARFLFGDVERVGKF